MEEVLKSSKTQVMLEEELLEPDLVTHLTHTLLSLPWVPSIYHESTFDFLTLLLEHITLLCS